MHVHIIKPLFLETGSPAHNFWMVKNVFKNVTLQILNFILVSEYLKKSLYGVMLIMGLFFGGFYIVFILFITVKTGRKLTLHHMGKYFNV